MLNLSTLRTSRKSKTRKTILGRGNASGRGNFSTRGVKGQRSRTGGGNKLYRLGMRHIILQTPKLRGFASLELKPTVINVGDLERVFSTGDRISPKLLREKGLVDNLKHPVKILGQGEIAKALTIVGCFYSGPAQEKILKAGGKFESVPKLPQPEKGEKRVRPVVKVGHAPKPAKA